MANNQNNTSLSQYLALCAQYNVTPDKNHSGDSGEKVVGALLSRFAFFNIYFLDGKAPIEDFVGEVADANKPYPFFVQVKSTIQGVDKYGKLQASLEDSKRLALLKRPIPTYLAGVDLNKLEVYLAPVFDSNVKYSTVPPSHVFGFNDDAKLAVQMNLLKDDIINFWDNQTDAPAKKTTYKSLL